MKEYERKAEEGIDEGDAVVVKSDDAELNVLEPAVAGGGKESASDIDDANDVVVVAIVEGEEVSSDIRDETREQDKSDNTTPATKEVAVAPKGTTAEGGGGGGSGPRGTRGGSK